MLMAVKAATVDLVVMVVKVGMAGMAGIPHTVVRVR